MKRGNAGANLPALRSHNAALVLDLLRTAGGDGISRLEIADRTGLTPQAVSKITARLRADGLAVEAGRRASTGGKPRTVLRLVRGARRAVGLHADRDELTAVLTDLTGEAVAVRTVPFDFGAAAEAVLETVVTEVRALFRAGPNEAREGGERAETVRGTQGAQELRDTAPAGPAAGSVLGVGVACPGPLDHRTGILGRVTGLPQWDGFPLRDALAARLGLPVVLDKDTNAAALGLALRGGVVAGEPGAGGPAPGVDGPSLPSPGGRAAGLPRTLRSGADRGESFAYLHVGTGLGAGLVLGGALYRGGRTAAGEFGHQVIQLDGPPCGCGNRGCIEALCLAAVGRGDNAEAARVLGTGAANLVGLLDIDRVLIGGRVALAHAEVFVRGVAAVLGERAAREGAGMIAGAGSDAGGAVDFRPGEAAGRSVPVAVAADGDRLVAHGAAQLVLAPLFGRAEAVKPISAPSDESKIR
ncbi:ROK family transcriptional regulator [Streptomyces sp. KR80]|uniref:ROK family transcriptional regulator n=1 Tax=Streptomyces sp. KR80 TaxID=3457426 RepID=UPI003FD103A0